MHEIWRKCKKCTGLHSFFLWNWPLAGLVWITKSQVYSFVVSRETCSGRRSLTTNVRSTYSKLPCPIKNSEKSLCQLVVVKSGKKSVWFKIKLLQFFVVMILPSSHWGQVSVVQSLIFLFGQSWVYPFCVSDWKPSFPDVHALSTVLKCWNFTIIGMFSNVVRVPILHPYTPRR